MPVPDVVEICMSQSIGAPAASQAKGDYVKVGQKIADFASAPIHSKWNSY